MNKEKAIKSKTARESDGSEFLLEFLSSSQESTVDPQEYPESEAWLSAHDVGKEIID